MQSPQSYLDRMGSNFVVAAMIPSLTFVTLMILVFQQYIPNLMPILEETKLKNIPPFQIVFLLILFTVIIGFTLSSLNTFVYKLFEGYILFWRFPAIKNAEINRARKIKKRINHLEKKIELLEKRKIELGNSDRLDNYIARLTGEKYSYMAYYQTCFPFAEDDILPTKFGNYLKAAEAYPRERYEIDTVPMWPRLIYVIPDSYYLKLDAKNNQLSFLLNCAVLSICFVFVSLSASLHQVINYYLKSSNPNLQFIPNFGLATQYKQYAIIYLVCSVIGLLAIRVFYSACLLIVNEYGDLIRSSFDLFRSELLQQLNYKRPKNSKEERAFWKRVSRFFTIGPSQDITARKSRPFKYHYRTEADKNP